MAHSRKPKLCL